MTGGSRLAVVAALLGNLLIAILKLVAGLVARSAAMLAEAAHSFSDVGNQVLLLIGISRSAGPPSEAHPYGTGKAAYFWPFLVAVLLFGVAGAYSLIEGIEKTLHPHELDDIRLALAVLGVSFVIELVSLSVAARQARTAARARGVLSLRQFLAENRDATLLTVLVEDSLALVGLPMAAAALLLSSLTGNPIWDGIGSVAIGLLLMSFAVFLAWEIKQLIVGRGLSRRDVETVRRVVSEHAEVQEIAELRSMYLGPDVVLLGLEVRTNPDLGAASLLRALSEIEQNLIRTLPILKFVYVEPAGEPAKKAPAVVAHGAHEPAATR